MELNPVQLRLSGQSPAEWVLHWTIHPVKVGLWLGLGVIVRVMVRLGAKVRVMVMFRS